MGKPNSTTEGRSKSGIRGLDDVLGGGFIPNRLYLVDGDPGSGKTTLALQYLMEGVRGGEKGLYVTLSESREEVHAAADSHGWSLDGVDIVEFIASDKDLNSDAQLTMYHHSEVELSETTRSLLEAVERNNPTRVVFDSLSELRLLAQNPLRYRRQILGFKRFFTGKQRTVILLDDRTSEGADTQLHSIAHGVVSLEQLAPSYGAERRRLRIVKLRGAQYRGGFHDFVIRRGGLSVFPRLVAAEHGVKFEPSPIKSGVTALDDLLGGGPDRGTSTLLIGPAGSGKSTLAAQYAFAAANRGEIAAFFAFDEGVRTLELRLRSLGIRLRDGIESGRVKIHQIDPAEISPGEFAHLIREAVERDGARVVVIDSLNGYMSAMPEERFLTVQLHEVLSYLNRRGVTTFMVVAQHGLVAGDGQAPVDASYLADSVILLRYFESAGKVRKAISVVKKRSGRHEDTIRELRFDQNGISLSAPLTQFQGVLSGVPTILSAKSELTLPNPPDASAQDSRTAR
jgi:circadian clock protein KaiC